MSGPLLHQHTGNPCTVTTSGILDWTENGSFTGFGDFWNYTGTPPIIAFSQSWKSGPNPSEITGIKLSISNIGVGEDGSLGMSIYAHSGIFGFTSVPTGPPLARSIRRYATKSLPGSEAFFEFAGWTPAPNTYYVAVIDQPYDIYRYNGSVATRLIVNGGGGSADGNMSFLGSPSQTWTTTTDTIAGFTVYSVSGSNANLGNTPTGFIADEQGATGTVSYVFDGSNPFNCFQSWTSPSYPSELTGVMVNMGKVGTPTGTITLSIRAHSGVYGSSSVPTGPDLVTSSIYNVSSISGGNNYFFDLSGWTPTASTNYVAFIDCSQIIGDVSNYLQIFTTTTNPTDGNFGTNDSIVQATYDMNMSVYSVADGSVPPITEDPVKSIDSGSLAVVTVSNVLSSDETNALKIDISQLAPEEGTGRPVREVYIEQIKAITSGVDVDILWDATLPEHCMTLTGNSGITYDFRAIGPLTNNAGAGKTGNILFSTNGATAGSSYSVTLAMRKKY